MTRWIDEIDLREEWQNAKDAKISIEELALHFATQIKLLKQYDSDSDLRDLGEAFLQIANKPNARTDEFDALLSNFYDWADQTVGHSESVFNMSKKCWVKLF